MVSRVKPHLQAKKSGPQGTRCSFYYQASFLPGSRLRPVREQRAHWRLDAPLFSYEQPEVDPQVSHFMQVPFRTSVKFAHSPQGSPS